MTVLVRSELCLLFNNRILVSPLCCYLLFSILDPGWLKSCIRKLFRYTARLFVACKPAGEATLYSGFYCSLPALPHQQNVNQSGSHPQTSRTLRSTSPVLLNNSICSQPPLDICKVLSDSARAFSGAPESTCSYGGAFRMPRYLTYRIVTSWSS
jgi:hypothetical protein